MPYNIGRVVDFMKSVPGSLEVGSLYTLHDAQARKHGSENKHILECIQLIKNDPYSKHTALVRSTKTGWTMVVHGTNIYEDGSIDWDFSTHGIFTDKDALGVLHQRKEK